MISPVPDKPLSYRAAGSPLMQDDVRSVAQRSQHLVEQSIQRNPGLSVGAAIAAGVVLGCLVKRK